MSASSPQIREAVANYVANGGNKARALRDAGFSQSVVRNPNRIFGDPKVIELIESTGFSPIDLILKLNKLSNRKKLEKVIFARKSNLSDDDIRQMLEEVDYEVVDIEYTQRNRIAWCYVDDDKIQMKASWLLLKLMGLVPVRKTIVSPIEQQPFSLASLRKSNG